LVIGVATVTTPGRKEITLEMGEDGSHNRI
jgi:hypothetical protein